MIKVISQGIYASIQDMGRYGFANVGVPPAGVMDQNSAKLANLILNNNINDALLEVALGRNSFQFLKDTVICICGADLNATLNSIELNLNHPIIVKKDSILKFGNPNYGARAYVGVKGGFLNKKVLKSRSFFKDVTKKYILKNDDEILYPQINPIDLQSFSAIKIEEKHFYNSIIEVYKGPEYVLLNETQRRQLESIEFTISKDNSRMGYKLIETIENNLESILTSAVMPGTVQLTPSGKLIVLMRDCQVTGGYPRVLQLTSNSINILAQKTTNHNFKFKIVLL